MARGPLVLILSTLVEPNVDRIISLLDKRKTRWFRFNTELFPLSCSGSIQLGSNSRGKIRMLGKSLRLDDVSCVWNRRHARPLLPPGLSPFEERFVENESASFQLSMFEQIDGPWVNNWKAEREANSKSLQLSFAAQEGFRVPKTLITNNPSAVRDFAKDTGGKILFKALAGTAPTTMDYSAEIKGWLGRHAPKLAAPRPDRLNDAPIVFSQMLSAEHLDKLENLRVCPAVFQEYINKCHELRITVVGSDIFAAEIHSQSHESTRVDFRRFALSKARIKHKRAVLRASLSERILRLVRRLGLSFACLDLIVTPEGEEVFLEANASGQWHWVQCYTGLPIDEALASLLSREQGAAG